MEAQDFIAAATGGPCQQQQPMSTISHTAPPLSSEHEIHTALAFLVH